MALEHGMDVKTLSAVIGHVSALTTLDIYTHITDAMWKEAADNIDRVIGRQTNRKETSKRKREAVETKPFEPYKGKRRKAGTGCVTQINDHLWEGRYSPKWPDGKKHARNIYAHSEAECEEKLAELIKQMKQEIAEMKK